MFTRKKIVASALATLLLAGMTSQSWASFEPGTSSGVASGTTYDAIFSATGRGMKIGGTLRGEVKDGWAGVFKVDLYQQGSYSHSVTSFCTNITHPTHVGDKYQVTSQLADCKVAYLVNHYPPVMTFSGLSATAANNEAAARQAAVWHFADGFTINTPDSVKARAEALITEVNQNANCDSLPQPVEITVSPNNQVALTGAPFYYTVTATQDGQPASGLTVHLTTSAGTLNNTSITTDSKGKGYFSVTSSDPATAVVEAKAVYTMPSGTLFQGVNPEQQILVFGSNEVQQGIATGAAHATWQSPQGSLTVNIFHDRNINGNKDGSSEEDLQGIVVKLINTATGAVVATATTDSSGLVTFPNIANGTYSVTYVLPNNHLDTNDPSNRLKGLPFAKGVTVNDDSHSVQFGLVKLPFIKACVFEDSMRNAAGEKVKFNRELHYTQYITDPASGKMVTAGYVKDQDNDGSNNVYIGQTDGVRQADEKPLKGWLVKLYRKDGSPVLGADGVTNEKGEVIINFLRTSDYTHSGMEYYIQTTQIDGSQWDYSKYKTPADTGLKPYESNSKWTASGLIVLQPNTYSDSCVSGINEIPLVAVRDSFAATATDNGIVVDWQGDGIGYNVWRAQKDGAGKWVNITKVTAQMLAAEATQIVDTQVASGETYFYALETIKADGTSQINMDMIRTVTAH